MKRERLAVRQLLNFIVSHLVCVCVCETIPLQKNTSKTTYLMKLLIVLSLFALAIVAADHLCVCRLR